jgi:hypothetical protein
MHPNDQVNSLPSNSALRRVMSQRGTTTGALDQTNPSAAVPTPGLPNRQAVPQGAVPPQAPQGMSAQQQAPQGQGMPVGSPEALVITKALVDRQKTLGKLGQ